MSVQSSKSFGLWLALLAVSLLLALDLFMFFLPAQKQAMPHLGVGVLAAQLISLLLFYKGDICPGQRGRLIKVNAALALYWAVWLVISLLPAFHHSLANVMSLCGLSVVYFIWKQPKTEKIRNSFLLMAALVAGLGILADVMLFKVLPFSAFAEYNPIAPILTGVVLANLFLVFAKSRLQGFIGLLPLVMIVLLALNAVAMLIFLVLNAESAVGFEGVFAYAIYFICHFVIAAILTVHSLQKWTLSTNTLFILLFIAACLPVWMQLGAV